MKTKKSTHRATTWFVAIALALLSVHLSQSPARGQEAGSGQIRQGETAPADDILGDHSGAKWGRTPFNRHTWDGPTGPLPTPGSIMPHAGDYVSSERNYFELVYMPMQTRVYLYDYKFRPRSAKDVQAQMTLQLSSEAPPRQIPFQFVPQPSGSIEQDYVAANFDIRPLQGKEASITFQFTLPGGKTAAETFTPHYDHFAIRPYIARAMVTGADQDAIAQQKTCPVMGVALGSRGPVVKLYVAEFPLYLSAEDCIAAVKQAPQKFVPQAPPVPKLGVE